MKRLQFPSLIAFLAVLLAGCGGSSSSGGGTTTTTATTTTTLAASPTAPQVGQTVTLTATVSASAGTATGTVTFYSGTNTLGTGTLTGNTATLTTSFTAMGSSSLTASYAGVTGFAASTSTPLSLSVGLDPTTTTLTATPTMATAGAGVILSATVASTTGTPAGTVTFNQTGSTTALGTATLSNGVATLTTTTLPAGTLSLTAGYAASGNFAASTSTPVTVTIAAPVAITSTTLSATPNPADLASPVTLSATVTSTGGTPAGTVNFADGSTMIGTGTLNAGVATFTTSTLAAGAHSLTASYGASTGFSASTSPAFPLTVNNTSAPSTINAHGSFSFSTANQTIAGFGGAEAFYATYLDNHPNETAIMTALFDPNQGLGLNFLRLQNNYYLYNGTNASTFDTDNTRIVTAATAAHGSPVTVEMSSWTPPASLKSNNSIDGCVSSSTGCTGGVGTLSQVNGAYNYAGFGTFWANSLKAYAALGVTPTYISIQNEPDFPATYVGCVFNPTDTTPSALTGSSQVLASYGKAFDATYQAIQSAGLASTPQMIGPETFSISNAQAMLTQVPTNELAVVAHHLYNVSSGGEPAGNGTYTTGGNPTSQVTPMTAYAAAFPTQTKFETEYYQTPGFFNAIDIHNDLTIANDNVYLFWGLTWPSTLENGVSVDQAGLLYIDNPFDKAAWAYPNGWTYNDAYYTMEHYSKFIKPGYIRYNATIDNTDELVSVFQSPDKASTVIVILNTSITATDGITLNLAGITYTNSSVYRSTFSTPITTAGAERWNNLGSYSSDGINLPPQSAVTVLLTQ